MASRKEQKEAARARRVAEEQARAEAARRQRRLQMVGGMVLAAIAVIVIVFAISSSGGATGLQKGKAATQTAKTVEALLQGIPQSGRTLGDPKAPVTMTYYGDLECPICRDFTLSSFPQMISNEVRQGKVKVVYRSFCTATCNGPGQSVFNTQQAAAYAAGEQDKFWYFAELFYHEQGEEDTGYVNQSYLDGLANQVPGLNISQWKSQSSDAGLLSAVNADESSGNAIGVTGTPTLIFQGPKGKAQPSQGVPSYSQLQQAIAQVS
jgi:protein-disulfide isomerase